MNLFRLTHGGNEVLSQLPVPFRINHVASGGRICHVLFMEGVLPRCGGEVINQQDRGGVLVQGVGRISEIIGNFCLVGSKRSILCVDEKSQIQALDRTQPKLPLNLGYVLHP